MSYNFSDIVKEATSSFFLHAVDDKTVGNMADIFCREYNIRLIWKKYHRRIKKTKYETIHANFSDKMSYVVVCKDNKVFSGCCNRDSEDKHDARIADMLCYSRALGWKDIEHELLDILD